MADRNAFPTAIEYVPPPSSPLGDEPSIGGEEEIIEERRVMLAAAYEPDATGWERSLARLVPELVDAGWTLTEDTAELRTWRGVIDGDTYARLADAWGLEHKPSEVKLGMPGKHGELASHSYTFDGLEWASGGWSPIVWMRLTVSEPIKRRTARPAW
jgi:hypothetical protein